MLRIVPLALLIPLTACALSPADQARQADMAARERARVDTALTGLTPGKSTRCINPRLVSNIEKFDGTILYRVSRNRLYRNDIPGGGCFGLKNDDIVVTKSFGSDTCEGDIVHTVSRSGGQISGSCALGAFVEYRR